MATIVRSLYVVEGWGVGEVWTRGRELVHHVLPGDDATLAELTAGGPACDGMSTRPTSAQHRTRPHPNPPNGGARPPVVTLADNLSQECADFVTDLCQRFARHLAGERVGYAGVRVVDPGWTEFERNLCTSLRRVRWGTVVTYGELAARAGRPGAARAAGSFCAAGSLSLVLPFHRVVAANGIGGYGADGVGVKRRLLALEGVDL